MPTPRLTLLSDWDVEETITFNVTEADLGDSYSQTVAAGMLVDRTWQLRSWVTDQSKLDAAVGQLSQYQGEVSFLWSPDDGDTVPLAAYYCEEWVTTPYGPGTWAIEGELISDPTGECELFRNDLDEATILNQMAGSIAWIAANTRATSPMIATAQGLAVDRFGGLAVDVPQGMGSFAVQMALIRSLMAAYRTNPLSASIKAQALSQANLLAGALETYFYGGVAVPAVATAQMWMAHESVNARSAFTSKGSQAPTSVDNFGYFDMSLNFTNGVATVPGGLLADVYGVYSVGGSLLWPHAGAPLDSGTGYSIAYWVSNLHLASQRYRVTPSGSATPTNDAAGTIVLTTAFTGTLWVAYSLYDGTTIATNSPFALDPVWRPIRSGEVAASIPAALAADAAYGALVEVTALDKWVRAKAANRHSVGLMVDLPNRSRLFRREVGAAARNRPGISSLVTTSLATGTLVRDADGGVRLDVSTGIGSGPMAEVRNTAIAVGVSASTVWRMEVACSVATWLEVVLTVGGIDYSASVECPTTAYVTQDLVPGQFVAWDSLNWWNSASLPYSVSTGSATAIVTRMNDLFGGVGRLVSRVMLANNTGQSGAAFTLARQTNQPPSIGYRSPTGFTLRVQDSAGVWFTWQVPPSSTYTTFSPTWANAGDGLVQSVEIRPTGATNATAEVWMYWIGSPPTPLPLGGTVTRHAVRSRILNGHSIKVGNCEVLNNPANTLKHAPGAVASRVRIMAGVVESMQGNLRAYDQDPAAWWDMGFADRAAQSLNALAESQAEYARRSPVAGLFVPEFRWTLWDDGAKVVGDWVWDKSGAVDFKALESVARLWFLASSDAAIATTAQRVAIAALRFLDGYLKDSDGMPPTHALEGVAPESRSHNPGSAALILKAALWANLAGGDRQLTYSVINTCFKYLISQYVVTGLMAGTHTAGQPAFVEGGNYRENRGEWVAELLDSLALLVQRKSQINLPPCSSAGNTRAPSSLPEIVGRFAFAGYRDGQVDLPTSYPTVLSAGDVAVWGANAIVSGGVADQAPKLNNIITAIKAQYNPNFETAVRLVLPTGRICTRSPIYMHCSHLTLSGAADGSTVIRFEPDTNTRYDVMPNGGSADGDDFDLSGMTWGDSNGGWIFPGRAAVRFGPVAVHPFYAAEFASAPANRKDFYFGSGNFPWRSGIQVNQSLPYAARKGDSGIPTEIPPIGVYAGGWVLVFAANTKSFYTSTGTTNPAHHRSTPIVRTRIHRVTTVDDGSIGVWPPLEFDIPRNQEADGDAAIDSSPFPTSYYSLVVPLDVVRGAGIEGVTIQQPMDAAPGVNSNTYTLTPTMAQFNYTNMAPEYAMIGVLLRWAVDCFVKGCTIQMAGSHSVATEFAANCTIEDNFFDGSWNKGAGGNGYLRLSKAWSCLVQRNTLRNLRHLTLQWSASGNVVKNNNLTVDLNVHGGWERFNLMESNTANIPFEHRYGTPSPTDPSAGSDWFPLWWGAGAHAGKWSSASGEANIVYNNTLAKQVTAGGPMVPYLYSEPGRIYVFGIPNTPQMRPIWTHLSQDGVRIPTWGQRETVNFAQPPNAGVHDLSKWEGPLHDYAKTIAPTRPQLVAYPGVANFAIESVPTRNTHLSARLSAIEQNSGLIYKIGDIAEGKTVLSEAPFVPTVLAVGGLNVWRFDTSRLNLEPEDARRAGTWIIHLRTDANTSGAGRILSAVIGDYAVELYPQGDFTRLQWALYQRTGPTTWSYVEGVTAASGEVPKGVWRSVAVTYDLDAKTLSMRVFGFNNRSTTFTNTVPAGAVTDGVWMGWRVISPTPATTYKGEIAEVIHFGRVLNQVEQWTAMDWIRYNNPTLT